MLNVIYNVLTILIDLYYIWCRVKNTFLLHRHSKSWDRECNFMKYERTKTHKNY